MTAAAVGCGYAGCTLPEYAINILSMCYQFTMCELRPGVCYKSVGTVPPHAMNVTYMLPACYCCCLANLPDLNRECHNTAVERADVYSLLFGYFLGEPERTSKQCCNAASEPAIPSRCTHSQSRDSVGELTPFGKSIH